LERYQKAFKTIKKIITRAECPITINYDFREIIYIITDTSLIRTEAVLSMGYIWKKACSVAFKFSKYILAKNYSIHKQKILAIVKVLKK